MVDFEFIKSELKGIPVYRFKGKLFQAKTKEIEGVLVKELEEKSQLVLDCSNLEFIDSSGIGMIMKLFGLINKGTGRLMVIKPNDELDASVLEDFLIQRVQGQQSKIFDSFEECEKFLEFSNPS